MKHQILIVDDDLPMRCFLRIVLSKKYLVTCKENGLEACDWLSKGNFPDLIICDMVMPEMDGLELLKTVRTTKLYRNIPVIILSTLEDAVTKQRCLNEGAIAYIHKPFDADHLMQAISRPLVA